MNVQREFFSNQYWAIQAALLTPLTFTQWICKVYSADFKGTSTCRFWGGGGGGEQTIFDIHFYCFRYDFSVALISALVLLKYASFRLTVVI